MPEQPAALSPTISRLRFAWLLPCAELGLCGMLLWPIQWMIYSELHIHLPGLIARAMYSNYVLWGPRKDIFLGLAAMLNLPAGILQLPYAIFFSPDKRDWNPTPMDSQLWRAITWSLLGLPFWWIIGRAVDALAAIKSGRLTPRIGWIETVLGFLLVGGCATAFAGLLFGLPEADRNRGLILPLAGFALWALLGNLPLIARFRQWRLRKKITASQPLNAILPNASSG
jgi:hypothetical protein